MIGWYVDIVVGFVIRTVVRFVKIRSREMWPVEKGTISSATCPLAVYGGPVAELGYTYLHKGEYYSGVHRKAWPYALLGLAALGVAYLWVKS